MENTLDILLRELHNNINKEIYITQAYHKNTVHFKMIPVVVQYDMYGIALQDKDGYGIVIDDDDFELTMNSDDGCLSFSFRDKTNKVYYTICL